jgi:hypothetical protein
MTKAADATTLVRVEVTRLISDPVFQSLCGGNGAQLCEPQQRPNLQDGLLHFAHNPFFALATLTGGDSAARWPTISGQWFFGRDAALRRPVSGRTGEIHFFM